MRRRSLVVGAAVSLVAVGLGVGTAMRRDVARPQPTDDEAVLDLWALSFATLEGTPLAMASLRGKPLLINFWATWCAPCVTEMPLIDAFARSPAAANWNVLALAVDLPAPVRRFRDERKISLPIALAGSEGLSLSRQLGNAAGGLPFTVAFDAAGEVAGRKLGAIDQKLLDSWTRVPR